MKWVRLILVGCLIGFGGSTFIKVSLAAPGVCKAPYRSDTTIKSGSSYEFWMKNMKFPIDIVWINENKTAVDVTSNVSPATYPKTFTSKKPAKYVLELRSGNAQRMNIAPGVPLQFNP
jgi:hypothetical protein